MVSGISSAGPAYFNRRGERPSQVSLAAGFRFNACENRHRNNQSCIPVLGQLIHPFEGTESTGGGLASRKAQGSALFLLSPVVLIKPQPVKGGLVTDEEKELFGFAFLRLCLSLLPYSENAPASDSGA